MMMRRLIALGLLLLAPLSWADWAADRDASAGYVTVTTLATAVDEAVPFCVVYLSDLPADFHTAMSDASDTDGKTIRVSTADGTTQLACVPIGVNTGTDTGCLIFLGTGMSASVDVDYRIYVGNASLTMPAASAGEQLVFAAYAGVYFPGVDTRDWTSGGRTLTAVNSPGTAASGYEGITAATYNGSNQYHKYEGTQAVTNWPATIENITSTDVTTSSRASLSLTYWTSSQNNISIIKAYTGVLSGFAVGNGGSAASASTITMSTSTNYYVTVTRDSTTGDTYAYVDGAQYTNAGNINAPLAFDRFAIGAAGTSSAYVNFWDGNIAVALLSSSVRSANYVSTMQDNWAGTMYSAGAWTPLDSGCTSGSTGFVLFGAITQTATSAVNWANITDAIVDDANTADVSLDETTNIESEQLLFSDIQYGTTIPTTADSYTITIRVKVDTEGGGKEINDLLVKFRDDTGTNVGDNLASVTQWPSSPGTRDYVVTGYTPDGTEFDADAGLAFSATGFDTAGSTLAEVYVAWIKIDWTCGDDAAKSRGFFALTE